MPNAPLTARPCLTVLIVGLLYWYGVRLFSNVAEPWDATDYWTLWCSISLILAAAAGRLFGRRGWLAGAIVTGAQLPFLLTVGVDRSSRVGLLLLSVLALPVMALSALTGRIMTRVWHRRPRAQVPAKGPIAKQHSTKP